MSIGIPAMWMRGGTSKALYFCREDLPDDVCSRDQLLLKIMGSPDKRQIDGVGGSDPLTSKVAIISSSEDPEVDMVKKCRQIDVANKVRKSYQQLAFKEKVKETSVEPIRKGVCTNSNSLSALPLAQSAH